MTERARVGKRARDTACTWLGVGRGIAAPTLKRRRVDPVAIPGQSVTFLTAAFRRLRAVHDERITLEGNPDAIRSGMGLFRGRCADCHGMDARGVRGPDITQVWASGRTDDGLFNINQGRHAEHRDAGQPAHLRP